MEGEPGTDGVAATAVADAEPSAQPFSEESGRQEQQADPARVSGAMNAFMRGQMGAPVATSKPEDGAPSGESTPSGDVEAGRGPERGPDGKFLPRRGGPERIAELERELAARDPVKLREQWENERTVREATDTEAEQARADAERYQRLRDLEAAQMSDEDWNFAETYRKDLNAAPVAVRKANALAEQTIKAERQALSAERNGILNTIAAEVRTGAAEFGVDPKAWGPDSGATWLSMTRDAVAVQKTVIAARDARIAELERELHSSRTVGPNGFGTVRVPALSGSSGGGTRSNSMNDWLRGR